MASRFSSNATAGPGRSSAASTRGCSSPNVPEDGLRPLPHGAGAAGVIEAGRVGGHRQRLHRHAERGQARPTDRPWRPSRRTRRAGASQLRGVVSGAQAGGDQRWPSARRRRRPGRSRTAPASGKPRAALRCAASASVATGVGRSWSRSAAIGLSRRSAVGRGAEQRRVAWPP